MAFEVRRGESLRRALRRMARQELRAARRAWSRPHRTLNSRAHDVRAALKKVRAIIRLVEPAVGKRATRAEQRLRRIAATLGPIRDAGVLVATFDHVVAAAGLGRNAGAGSVREHLLANARHEAQRPRTRKAIERIDRALRRSRRRVDEWTPRSGSWRVIAAGLEKGYRRSRRAMGRAHLDPSGETFHAWRRALKAHRHQVRVLEPWWPRVLDAQLEELGELDTRLGQEHDLTVLEETVLRERACFPDEHHCSRLLAELEERRERLRDQMLAPGARLFAEKPSAFRRRMHRYFDAFREEAPGIAERVLDPEAHASNGRTAGRGSTARRSAGPAAR